MVCCTLVKPVLVLLISFLLPCSLELQEIGSNNSCIFFSFVLAIVDDVAICHLLLTFYSAK